MAVNYVTTSNVRWYDGDSIHDGCGLGSSTSSKIGFYAATPVSRQTVTAGNLTSIQAALVALGLFVTA